MSDGLWRLVVLAGLVLASGAVQAQALRAQNEPLRDVIERVERETTWRFLYSDALVAGKRVSLSTDTDGLPDALSRALAPLGIGVDADRQRRRILLVPAPKRTPLAPEAAPAPRETAERVVRGRVLDSETGEGLPFATVVWDGGRRGVVADDRGGFVLTLRGEMASGATALTASFVGYGAQTATPRGSAITFRLAPEAGGVPTVVVDARAFTAPLDTAWAARIQPGRYDALGEGGGLRALEVLPSVAPAAAFSDGLIVRGSPSDAFEVRLDGVPVYNPRHLFGLVDAFNADALRAVALHLGVAPAQVAVAPGGALDYVTATGAPTRPLATLGVSSLAARGSASVPVRPGRTTLLVGGRTSALGASPGTADALVEQGLGVATRTSDLPSGTADALSRLVDVSSTRASYWDLHLGAADQRASGGRTALTAYTGGDETEVAGARLYLERDDDDRIRRVERPVAARNRWGSSAASLTDQRILSARWMLTSRVGASTYSARFAQDDFAFRSQPGLGSLVLVDTLGYDNHFQEAIAEQRVEAALGGGVASGGYSLHLYRQRYEETAARRAAFVTDQTATRLDVHAAWEGTATRALHLDAGLRAHMYSEGSALRLSPRVRARVDAAPGFALSASLGRSTQFAHRLTLANVAGAAAWVLTDSEQTVTEADLAEVSADLSARGVSVQLTAYAKRTRGLWLHTEDRSVRGLARGTVLQRPWLTGVASGARGVETLVRVPVGAWSLGASGALARATFQHPELEGGEAFPAEWDRPVQFAILADGPVLPGVRVAASWTLASGAPNPLAPEAGEEERLPGLSRVDLRVTAEQRIGRAVATLSLAVRNVLDRDNAFTREATNVVRLGRPTDEPRLLAVPLDIYDVGVLPTLDLALRF
ncbi:TonB-dependent receptor [Rubricoccus marinus]|uniref:TonB-dependent receptor-like beta-barrel domain-containing protein n=1 Tax=Rubricoccus marinus TaxID=716817 RepID=A0A259U1D8_9BACT|nr:TonB-dependent receptor [Rubricoccus marinus]OZC03819.1 hypothetical protein BSZ36_12975 [Rubricoccus marinus]